MKRALGCFAAALMVSACASAPPPRWAEGGTSLQLPAAFWSRGDSTIELRPDGKVLIDNGQALGIDAAGRVFETDGDPIAVLQPDGYLVGKDNTSMGFVGPVSATFPGSDHAWFTIGSRGEVVRYDTDGEHSQDGVWQGCAGASFRTCTLVTHVVLLRELRRRPRIGIGIGFGMGVMH
jgi:hypothetical protein